MKRLLFAFRNLFQKRKVEQELDQEIQFHLEMQIEQNLQKGMGAEEARRQALLTLGGLQQTKEKCREVRAAAFVDDFKQDLRYAIRSLLRSYGLVIVVLLTLTLGIAANTAIFSVAQAVLFRPLPFPDPERLVMIWHREKDGSPSNTNFATYQDWKERLHSFESIAVMSSWEPVLNGYGDPSIVEGLSVSRDFFRALGIGPFLGRDFLDQEDRPDHNRVVILTHTFWQRKLGGDPSIVGKQIVLNTIPRTVVGILPPQFESIIRYTFREAEVFRPLGYDATLPYACRSCNHLTALGRIKKGVSFEQAHQEIDRFTAALAKQYPNDYGIAGATLVPLQEQIVSKSRGVLLLLLFAVAIVLLIGCTNIANLMLARATRRAKEMAIRGALGASRGRLLRQLLTESLLLALTGGTLGILLSHWATEMLIRYAPATIPRLQNVSLDPKVLLFACATTILCGIIFGLVPALHASRLGPGQSLQESSRSVTAERQKLRKALVVGNIAMALMLLTGAGLLFQSIKQLLSQELGFQKENVISMTINLVGLQYDDPEKVDLFYKQVLEKIHSLPETIGAGVVSQLPLSTNLDMYGIEVKDKPLAHHGEAPSAERFAISPGYLSTLKIPVIRGRGITNEDHAKSMPVVLVNRTFARRMWPGEDPIGKQIHIGEKERPWRTVVGIVEDVRHRGLQEPFAMQFYMPYQQWFDTGMTLVVRTSNNPTFVLDRIRKSIWHVDPKLALSQVATMEQVVDASLAQKTFALRLIEFFALTALLLAAIGLYGVMAYSVTARFREIGVRMALGADRSSVLTLILRSGFVLTLCGIFLGLLSSFVFLRFLKNLLFRVTPFDPVIVGIVALILFGVSFAACVIPAIRASRLNPITALHQE